MPVPHSSSEASISPDISPLDEHNRQLLDHVRPPDWQNPDPQRSYNLVILGAGTSGLVAAAAVAGLGGKVALIEKNLLGGDCLNVGCVPSKALIRSSRFYADLRNAPLFGGSPSEVRVEFPAVMERMRKIRARLSRHDSAARFRALGVDVFLGNGRFAGPNEIEIESRVCRFKKALIATGGRPEPLELKGISEVGYLTNETIFNLTELPRRLLVIGGGPIGCELAQAFQRLGSRVTIVQIGPKFLPREERDAAQILGQAFQREGLEVRLDTRVTAVEKTSGGKRIHLESAGIRSSVEVDEILVGIGRTPNIEGLNLEGAGIQATRAGVKVNDYLQTTNPNVYAAGDVCLGTKFTHMADATARLAVQNALFLGRKKLSTLTIPWCTYTDPEIAHVGIYAFEARRRGILLETYTVPMHEVDRAVTDSEEEGFAKIHLRQGTDEILGATIVARHAGEMISEVSLAMVAGVGLKVLARVIHPYPTQCEAIKKAADAYLRSRLTPPLRKLSSGWLEWQR